MKCLRQPIFLQGKPVQIASLIEVYLAAGQWRHVVQLARQRRRTFSTVTRFCVLRLANKCRLGRTARLERARVASQLRISRARAEGRTHRHQMCLYGDDEKLIRLAAMDLGMTLSAFVRLALELYLHLLAMEKQSPRQVTDASLTENAIRLVEAITILASQAGPFPVIRECHCWHWDLESYW